MNVILEKTFVAGAAIAACTIVKHGAADDAVIPAAAATDSLLGVASRDFDTAIGERIDIMTQGVASVKLAGTVTRGGPVTSNAAGLGVAAAPAAGSNVRVIGVAMQSGVAGDVIDVLISQSVMQG
ncbi:phage cement protein [Variovorax sp. VNK109]|uniref:gp53 minor capsid family protein n=1 Tax=Variovorax sp. VNK109 TaxID=3400919 RepID=UPI003BFE7801